MKVIVFREPASTVVGPDAFGAPASVGTGIKYAREDHDHGLPANPAPNPATTVTGPDAFGDPSVVGTATNYAREDHNHGLPAAPTLTEADNRVNADETTTSVSYTNLATAGPAVTVTVGASGKALVVVSAKMYATAATGALMGCAVSGASTVAPDDGHALGIVETSSNGSTVDQASYMMVLSGLTAGSNTFTAKYHSDGTASAHFGNRTIIVIPL